MFIKFGKIYEVKLPPGKRAGSSAGFGFVNFTNQADAEKAIRDGNARDLGGRQIAVDWAVAREQYQEAMAAQKGGPGPTETASPADDAMDVDVGGNKEEEKQSDDSDESSSGEADQKSGDEEKGSDEEDEDDDEDDDGEDDGSDEEEKKEEPSRGQDGKTKKQHSTDVHLGKTLFVRNLAYATTQETLQEKFETWGKLRYAVLVKNRQTGEPMGTAFIQFADPADADRCLEDAYASKAFKTARHRITARDNESDILLDGRRLIITKAVTREQASDFKNVGDDRAKKRDPRNLALASAGVIQSSTPEGAKLSKDEIARRQRGEHDKKMKLANPNFHVSRTRLSVRNLPKEMDEPSLRRIFLNNLEHLKEKGISTKLNQVKVARDPSKENKSRGFGFVEFENHAAALEALKKINNSDKILPGGHRLIVEFSIENSLVLQKRAFRQQKAKDNAKGAPATSPDGSTEATPSTDDSTPSAPPPSNPKTGGKPGKQQNPRKRARPEKSDGDSEQPAAATPENVSKPAPKRQKTAEGFNSKPKGKPEKKGPSVSLGGQTRKQRSAGAKREKSSEQKLEKLIDNYRQKFD